MSKYQQTLDSQTRWSETLHRLTHGVNVVLTVLAQLSIVVTSHLDLRVQR